MSGPVDVSQLAGEPLAEAEFPGGRTQAFRIHFRPEAHAEAWAHAAGVREVEICGVLVGTWARDAVGPFVSVGHVIRGEAAASKHAEVTFTHETWARINARMDSDFAGLSIVGWYHSHPDFGVFLSDRDRFIQESFFANPGQIALVIDPIRGTEGVFVWKDGLPVPAPTFWVGDGQKASVPAGEEAARPTFAPPVPAGDPTPVADGDGGTRVGWLGLTVFGLCLFALGVTSCYLFLSRRDESERRWLVRAAQAETLLNKGIKVGLGERLGIVSANVEQAIRDSQALQREHLEMIAEDDRRESVRKRWVGVRERLNQARQVTEACREIYSPDEEVFQLMERLVREAEARKEAEKSGDNPAERPKKEGAGPNGTD